MSNRYGSGNEDTISDSSNGFEIIPEVKKGLQDNAVNYFDNDISKIFAKFNWDQIRLKPIRYNKKKKELTVEARIPGKMEGKRLHPILTEIFKSDSFSDYIADPNTTVKITELEYPELKDLDIQGYDGSIYSVVSVNENGALLYDVLQSTDPKCRIPLANALYLAIKGRVIKETFKFTCEKDKKFKIEEKKFKKYIKSYRKEKKRMEKESKGVHKEDILYDPDEIRGGINERILEYKDKLIYLNSNASGLQDIPTEYLIRGIEKTMPTKPNYSLVDKLRSEWLEAILSYGKVLFNP